MSGATPVEVLEAEHRVIQKMVAGMSSKPRRRGLHAETSLRRRDLLRNPPAET